MRGPLVTPSRAALVVGLAALPPTVWFLHLSVTYAIVPESCAAGTTAWLNLATLFGAALIVGGGVLAAQLVRNGRVLEPRRLVRARDLDGAAPAAERSVPRLALLFAPYFLLLVAMGGMVFLVVDPCA